MTIDEEERAIIMAEIYRLTKAYDEAQERYGITGSPSTDRTMDKYQTLIMALEVSLKPPTEAEDSWHRQADRYWIRIKDANEIIVRYAQAGRIPADVANIITQTLGMWV